jgi:hypothetical protein
MCPSDFSDELFESMTPVAGQIPASQELRDSVLGRTTRTIRNRRRVRRAGVAAALIGCYLAGMATVSLRPASRETSPFVADSAGGNGESAAGVGARKMVRPEDDQIASDSVRPASARLTPYDRLRRTGDQQLEEYADIPGATRSYQKALQIASADQRKIAPDRDSWLLMALKHSSNYN